MTNRDASKGSPERYLEAFRRYRETVLGAPSERGERAPGGLSIADVLFLGHFLRDYPRGVVAVEASAGPGTSALWLAGHPNVATVISVSVGSRVPEAFSAVVAEHPEEEKKIRVVEGGIGDIPLEEGPSGEQGMVALLDGSRSRRDVGAWLAALFRLHRGAVVFVGGCRGDGFPFVQAGIADFLGSSRGSRHFRAVADLGPALALCDLGIVYTEATAAELEAIVERVAREFTRKLDPLRLLGREEELVAAVTDLNRRLSGAAERERRLEDEHAALLAKQRTRLRRKISGLEREVAELRARQSGRRYRLADALAERALRVPGLKGLARRNAPPAG